MKNWLFLLLLSTQLLAITRKEFNDVMLGTPLQELTQKLGPPYAVKEVDKETQLYIYIERFTMNNELLYDNRYTFTIVNDQVTNKRLSQVTQPGYDMLYQQDPNYPTYP